jgi:hypothetical protein
LYSQAGLALVVAGVVVAILLLTSTACRKPNFAALDATNDAAPTPGAVSEFHGSPPPCYPTWESFNDDIADGILEPPCEEMPTGASGAGGDPNAPMDVPQELRDTIEAQGPIVIEGFAQ